MIIHSNSDDYNKKKKEKKSSDRSVFVESCHFTVLYIIIVLLSHRSHALNFSN